MTRPRFTGFMYFHATTAQQVHDLNDQEVEGRRVTIRQHDADAGTDAEEPDAQGLTYARAEIQQAAGILADVTGDRIAVTGGNYTE